MVSLLENRAGSALGLLAPPRAAAAPEKLEKPSVRRYGPTVNSTDPAREPETGFDDPGIDSPMEAILARFPGARRALFSRYHLGGCQSCGFSPAETLAGLAKRAGDLDPVEMLDHLRRADAHDRALLVSPARAREMLAADDPPLLLDTRTREEHEAVAIPGSAFMDQDLQQRLFAGDPGRAILLYDHTGGHVLDHASWFHGHGLKQTRAIEGGIDAWSREIDPTLKRYRLEVD